MRKETLFVHGKTPYDERTGAISTPIYQSATFRHPGLYETTGYDYSRLQNPTREELEKTMALMEGGIAGFAFSSGMAAISAMMEIFHSGDHILVSEDLYGGSYRLFEEVCKHRGITFTYIDSSKLEEYEEKLQENTAAFFVETPSNPMMNVADLQGIIKLAKKKGILTVVDNTFLTPYYQRPLELGADIVVHSGTKYLGGHNDTMAGFVVVRREDHAEKMGLIIKTLGSMIAPFDAWLILRGIKTLALRMERIQSNAMIIARWLQEQPQVEKVYYVGLEDHPGYEISCRQAAGFGGMISFTVKDTGLIEQILRKVSLIAFAESLGGVESLITYPRVQTHAAIPEEIRNRVGVTENLLRLSVGIEHVEDLIEDLAQALKGE